MPSSPENAIYLIAACAQPYWAAARFMLKNEVETRPGGRCRPLRGVAAPKSLVFQYLGLFFGYEICLQTNADERKQLLI
jgi:hypothetical protein